MRKSRPIMPVLLAAIVMTIVALAAAQAAEKEAPKQVLITNVSVWDGTSDSVKKGVDVLVEANLIKQVGKGIKAPGAEVIDGGGRVLMPGLIEPWKSLPPVTRRSCSVASSISCLHVFVEWPGY